VIMTSRFPGIDPNPLSLIIDGIDRVAKLLVVMK
jgi:hypothetical protein